MTDVMAMLVNLAPIVTAAGVGFVWWQVRVARKAMADDHERSRRQFAIEVTREWNRSVKPETSAARRLIAKLEQSQCRSIANCQPVKIDAKHEYLVGICLGKKAGRELKEGLISLDDTDIQRLRYLGVDYLNELEMPLSAWHQKVGDEQYLELEFGSTSDEMAMSSFREALGETYRYPALEEFLRWKERKQQNPRPEELGI